MRQKFHKFSFSTEAQGFETDWSAKLSSAFVTELLGQIIGQRLQGGETLLLVGDLGAGKTTLVRGVAQGFGVPSGVVNSPTFTFVQEYTGNHPLMHVDLYRIEHPEERAQLGLAELFNGTNVVVIEWADRIPNVHYPADHLIIRLAHQTRQSRLANLVATGPVSTQLSLGIYKDFRQNSSRPNSRRKQAPS